MKKIILQTLVLILFYSCGFDLIEDFEDSVSNTLNYNPGLTVIQNLTNGVSVLDILEQNDISSFSGLEYGGGFIFHVDENTGRLIVATDFSEFGDVAWGDVFELDTSPSIGDGDINTLEIIEGNQDDNSINGTEFGDDNYAFKIVDDLNYNGYNDWFIPSSGSMELIYNNIHSLGQGNFDESLFYWSSTKESYFPYVMGFNLESGGIPFPGSCLEVNGLIIARKVN